MNSVLWKGSVENKTGECPNIEFVSIFQYIHATFCKIVHQTLEKCNELLDEEKEEVPELHAISHYFNMSLRLRHTFRTVTSAV